MIRDKVDFVYSIKRSNKINDGGHLFLGVIESGDDRYTCCNVSFLFCKKREVILYRIEVSSGIFSKLLSVESRSFSISAMISYNRVLKIVEYRKSFYRLFLVTISEF